MTAMIVIGAVVVGAALALIGYPSRRVASEAGNTQPKGLLQPVHDSVAVRPELQPAPLAASVATVAATHVEKAIVEKPKQAPVVTTRNSPADLVPSPPPAAAAAMVAGPSVPETAVAELTSAAPTIAPTPDAVSETVTISGCLETTIDEDQFRLTDTDGAEVPKARSWRSGFLKKRSAPVELVELADALALRKHVGHRVVATGLLTGRELRVRSFQAAGASCN